MVSGTVANPCHPALLKLKQEDHKFRASPDNGEPISETDQGRSWLSWYRAHTQHPGKKWVAHTCNTRDCRRVLTSQFSLLGKLQDSISPASTGTSAYPLLPQFLASPSLIGQPNLSLSFAVSQACRLVSGPASPTRSLRVWEWEPVTPALRRGQGGL